MSLDEVTCWFVGLFSFDPNLMNFLCFFPSADAMVEAGDLFQSFRSRKLALFNHFPLNVH